MNNKRFIYEGDYSRIDKYLVTIFPTFSRSQIQMMIRNDQVRVNEKISKANLILKNNDIIDVTILDPVNKDIVAQNIPLDIYYEDKDVIVVNKSYNMVVHPAVGNYTNTLVNALMYHCKDLSGINGEIRAGIVHRIDKDTSGLLVACKNDLAHRDLSEQFKNKEVTRKYIAICSGVINHDLGKIDAPIGRDPENRQKMTIVDKGKNAITHFRVLERFKNHTLLELNLETGRTHQIRVHMKYIGFPITGDPLYGKKNEISPYGQFLHAKTLGFRHPRTNEWLDFTSPLPDYFEKYIEQLRRDDN